jgi:hypothetical protein
MNWWRWLVVGAGAWVASSVPLAILVGRSITGADWNARSGHHGDDAIRRGWLTGSAGRGLL